jgi:AcrR family transcriptional regulator
MARTLDPVAEQLATLRRNQILDAATTVFASQGFQRATMKEIAQIAGIASGTIYTYFPSKADVLLGLLNRLNESEQRAEQLAELTQQDLKSVFVTYTRQRMALFWSHAEVIRAVLPELLVNGELRAIYYQQIVEPTLVLAEQVFHVLLDQRRIRRVDPSLSVRTFAGTIFGLLLLQLLGDQPIAANFEQLPEVLATLLFEGLQPKDEETSFSPEEGKNI